jgi:polyisoprenoid-binding protein YceI
MKKIIIPVLVAVPFFFASCGGAESDGDTTSTDSTAVETEEVEVIVMNYNVDTANSIINWTSFEAGETGHQGTVKALSGAFEITTTGDEKQVTAASLEIDMNSIEEPSEKLVGHLKNEDFFDVNTYAKSSFTFDRHEDGMIYGTAKIVDKELPVEAPVTISESETGATVEVGAFKLDFTSLEMPFFVKEADAPEEEKHDPNIEFSATIVGTK